MCKKNTQRVHPSTKTSDKKYMVNSRLVLYPDGDLDHCPNLMGSKLGQDPSSNFEEYLTSSINVIVVTNKQTNEQTDRWS